MYYFSSSLSNWVKSGTKVTWWNNEPRETNFYNIPDVLYKKIDIEPALNFYFQGKSYYMPMKEFI